MSKLSQQAQGFMTKILKHYPLNPVGHNQATQQSHKHSQKPQEHLHDYRKERQIYGKSTKQKLQNIEFFKEEGNEHYKNGRYTEACYFYQKAIVYGDYTFPENQQETDQMTDLLQKSFCNLGLCLIKLQEWDKAKINLIQHQTIDYRLFSLRSSSIHNRPFLLRFVTSSLLLIIKSDVFATTSKRKVIYPIQRSISLEGLPIARGCVRYLIVYPQIARSLLLLLRIKGQSAPDIAFHSPLYRWGFLQDVCLQNIIFELLGRSLMPQYEKGSFSQQSLLAFFKLGVGIDFGFVSKCQKLIL